MGPKFYMDVAAKREISGSRRELNPGRLTCCSM